MYDRDKYGLATALTWSRGNFELAQQQWGGTLAEVCGGCSSKQGPRF